MCGGRPVAVVPTSTPTRSCPAKNTNNGSSGRRAARATLGGGFPTRTLSICAAGSHFPMVHVSAQPPSHPGRSDFPSPVGGSSQFPQGTFPCQSKLKHSSAYTPGRHGYNLDSTCERRLSPLPGSKPGSVTSAMPTTHREPLCPAKGVTPPSGQRQCAVSVSVTRPSSLVPAHASDQNPSADFSCP